MALILWMKLLISCMWHLELQVIKVGLFLTCPLSFFSDLIGLAHLRQASLATGAQLATRGRRDMSSRVRDVVLSLALCHNVGLSPQLGSQDLLRDPSF